MQNRLSIFGIDTTGKTTLMWASIRGHDQIVELLLSNGVDLHWRDINGKTALEFGIKYNHLKCVKIMFIYSHYIESYIESVPMS
jgi:ankyrin repeat protein